MGDGGSAKKDLLKWVEGIRNTKKTETDNICIGDVVVLFCEETKGFVVSYQSSTVHKGVAVGLNEDPKTPELVFQQSIMFEVCSPNRYKEAKKYRKMNANKEKILHDNNDPQFADMLIQTKKAAEEEEKENQLEQQRLQAKQLNYGEIIQLKHIFTGKYLHANATETSGVESNNLKTDLLFADGKTAQFRVRPRYKVKTDGEPVKIGDLISLESVKSPTQFMHASANCFGEKSIYEDFRELNISTIPAGFTVYLSSRAEMKQMIMALKGGSMLQLFHKEMEGYMTAEGVFGGPVVESVHLRIRPINASSTNVNPTKSAITCWTVEKESCTYDGNPILWGDNIRLRHATTRQYLMINTNNSVGLTLERKDPLTVFRLVPVDEKTDAINEKCYLRIQHVITSFWLAGEKEPYTRLERVVTGLQKDELKSLSWSKAPLKRVTGNEKMTYDDAYTLQLIPPELMLKIFYAAGHIPFLQKLLFEFKMQKEFSQIMKRETFEILKELKDFMEDRNVPVKLHQKLVRNFRVVDILIDVLKIDVPSEQSPSQTFIISVQAECYTWLQRYLAGDSRKNELYVARHYDFLENQCFQEGKIGLNATYMLMELLRGNLILVDLVSDKQIERFISLILKVKSYRYLELLDIVCIVKGMAMYDKQCYVANQWLIEYAHKQKKNVVDYLAMGRDINMQEDTVYISIDNKRTWIALHDFCTQHDQNSDQYKFFEYQLVVFNSICKGRNAVAIEIVCEEMELLTLEIAYSCLKDERLPYKLRSKFCMNITDIFVDVQGNTSTNDREQLVFSYHDVQTPGQAIVRKERHQSILATCVPLPLVKEIKLWITSFLEQNGSMVASKVAKNHFIEQLLILVYNLADFGYYGDTEDVKKLVSPMLSVMDGRNDVPFPLAPDQNAAMLVTIDKFKKESRFSQTVENTAIVGAKYRACTVMNLLFNLRFKTRLLRFLQEFKITIEQQYSSELAPFFESENDFRNNPVLRKIALKKCTEIFKETDFFGPEFVAVLKDLQNYHYGDLVGQALLLLNRFYSSHENLFRKCVQSKLVLTEKSLIAFRRIAGYVPELKLLKSSKMGEENLNRLTEILQELTKLSCLENDIREPHPLYQELIYNHDVLGDIFDLLTKASSLIGKNKKVGTAVLKNCFRFLKALAKHFPTVQSRLFDRLNFFLSIKKEAQTELGEMLIEIFHGNMQTCLKVETSHINTIVQMYLESLHPVWLSVLAHMVVVRHFPVKRNQGMVLKAIMHDQETLEFVTESTKQEKMAIIAEEDVQRHRFVGVVNLLSLCAFGDNKSAESICQCILFLPEVLEYVNMPKICYGLRTPFVQYLVNVFLASSSNATVQTDLRKPDLRDKLIDFISIVIDAFHDGSEILKENRYRGIEYLRSKPTISHKNINDVEHERKETMSFCSETAVPFIYALFKQSYIEQLKIDSHLHDQLIGALMEYANSAAPCISLAYQKIELINTIRLITVVTGKHLQIPPEFIKGHSVMCESRAKYEQYYRDELVMNVKFDSFATRLRIAYEGRNTIKFQIGYPSERRYADLDSEDYLPLGNEFQELVRTFRTGTDHTKRLYDVRGIMTHLQYSSGAEWHSETEKFTMAQLDLKLVQILRAMIHNEIVRCPEIKRENPEEFDRVMHDVITTQEYMNDQSIVESLTPHLARAENDIVREVFNLFNILYRGTDQTPKAFVRFVKETRHESFFTNVQERLLQAESLIREQRFLLGSYEKIVAEFTILAQAVEFAETQRNSNSYSLMKVIKVPQVQYDSGSTKDTENLLNEDKKHPEFEQSTDEVPPVLSNNLSTVQGVLKAIKNLEKKRQTVTDPILLQLDVPHDRIHKDTAAVNVILYMLQSLCDLQFTEAQNLCREQPNARVINLVVCVVNFVGILTQDITVEYIDMTSNALNSVCELVRGNSKNEQVAFEMKIIDHINQAIRHDEYPGSSEEQIEKLFNWIAYALLYMVEENQKTDASSNGTVMVMNAVDCDAIWTIMITSHSKALDTKAHPTLSADVRKKYLETGYLHFNLLCRAKDLGCFKLTGRSMDAWRYFEASVMSVELVKRNLLQKFQFRVHDQKALRKEVEEKLSWEVDRTAGGQKIRDYMAWAKDIVIDIKAQRRINANRIGSFLTRRWRFLNYSVLMVSAVVQVILIFLWETNFVPILAPLSPGACCMGNDTESQFIQYGFGAIHLVLSICLFISYFLSNVSGFQAWLTRVKVSSKNLWWKFRRVNQVVEMRKNHLEAGLFSGSTVYYIVFVAFSVFGTMNSPALLSFHLLQISNNNQLLSRVIKAVTTNGQSLLWVLILGMILIYIHALIGFLVLREIIIINGYYCGSLWECTLTMLREGLIMGVKRLSYPVPYKTSKNFGDYVWKLVFDMSFFILILTIMLNVIFGIIVDTFRQLRDSKWKTEKEMQNRCFICGRNSYEFEQRGINFNYHIRKEHSMIAYIFLLLKIEDTADPYLSANEMHVQGLVAQDNYGFFPTDRSLTLDGISSSNAALARDTILKGTVSSILQLVTDQRKKRSRMSANRQQHEWQKRNLKRKFGRSNSAEDLHLDGSLENLNQPQTEQKTLKFQPKRTPPPATPNFAPSEENLRHYETKRKGTKSPPK